MRHFLYRSLAVLLIALLVSAPAPVMGGHLHQDSSPGNNSSSKQLTDATSSSHHLAVGQFQNIENLVCCSTSKPCSDQGCATAAGCGGVVVAPPRSADKQLFRVGNFALPQGNHTPEGAFREAVGPPPRV